jgi:hypothetical protein
VAKTETMKDKLVRRSAVAAHRAIGHYLSKEYDQFFIQAGISFELLGKARLAAIHPSLIIDKDFDSLLHVCGAAKHSKKTPWNLKTIAATEVLRRCTQLHPELGTFTTYLTLLAEHRNSTIHLGEVPESETAKLFRAYLSGSSVILIGLNLKPEEIFGDFAEMVSKHLDESLTEVKRVVAEKLALAKSDFRSRYAALDGDHLKTVVNVIEGGYETVMTRYQDELVTCPACGNLGIASGDYDVDWQAEYDDESGMATNAFPLVTLKPSVFKCNICGLCLDDAAEIVAAGLQSSIYIENVEPSDFYEEPDY